MDGPVRAGGLRADPERVGAGGSVARRPLARERSTEAPVTPAERTGEASKALKRLGS